MWVICSCFLFVMFYTRTSVIFCFFIHIFIFCCSWKCDMDVESYPSHEDVAKWFVFSIIYNMILLYRAIICIRQAWCWLMSCLVLVLTHIVWMCIDWLTNKSCFDIGFDIDSIKNGRHICGITHRSRFEAQSVVALAAALLAVLRLPPTG